MASYKSSIQALQELLLVRTSLGIKNSRSYNNCRITKISQNISYLINRVEYYFVEVTCDDGTQYGIQFEFQT
jgi:hypothetical protein